MAERIDRDKSRFDEIVKGRIRKNLKEYISDRGIVKSQNGKNVRIPIPNIGLPRFTHGSNQGQGQGNGKGVGSGKGSVGDLIDKGDEKGEGGGKAGNSPGDHSLDVDVSMEDLAKILGEELELPRIEPKGTKSLITKKDKYSSLRRTGPETLRNFKKSFFNALKRQISSKEYNPEDPIVVIKKEDKRYRSWKTIKKPETCAVIFFVMDVSGSMGSEQKEIVRQASFWIQLWLRSQFEGLEIVYIIHDSEAKEVDEDRFFRTRESGGTIISSAYEKIVEIVEKRYSPADWNIYCFQFSDGDNWSEEDNQKCMKILNESILPFSNLFCYGQCVSPYGSGKFMHVLLEEFPEGNPKLPLASLENKDSIYDAIRIFLSKGS